MESVERYLAWVGPWKCELPSRITKMEYVKHLSRMFQEHGWDLTQPALVGYFDGGKVILLNGTHRCCAARWAEIEVPVVIYDESYIRSIWGNQEAWKQVMASGNDVTHRLMTP